MNEGQEVFYGLLKAEEYPAELFELVEEALQARHSRVRYAHTLNQGMFLVEALVVFSLLQAITRSVSQLSSKASAVRCAGQGQSQGMAKGSCSGCSTPGLLPLDPPWLARHLYLPNGQTL
ncbi:MAG: hypothetical protein IVW51_10240 [Thermaceae bacterium]|nr:hypothetical protein [Thermaceae bacterium]